jgi:hypothetical protein
MSTNTQKLRVLRTRTDHDLTIVVQRELDRGFALVDVAATRNSPFFAQAERVLGTATAWLPRIAGITRDERLHFERRVNELRSRLDRVPAYANVRSFPASFAS